ncbi:hypothetical protein [Zoogloea sp.]|uniref:hypothetical protein n=1 Tax=Zoogloea sp. TaxID=49181 RepID=UPI0014165F93|nr:MAG: hypothetical protein F9K15_12720 [Zoogloea sp.]
MNILKEVFPEHDWEHARKSVDGTEAVIEYEVTPDLEQFLAAEEVIALEHQEAVEYLSDPDQEGIWYITHEEEA